MTGLHDQRSIVVKVPRRRPGEPYSLEWFAARIDHDGSHLLWRGARRGNYARLRAGTRVISLHRAVLELVIGRVLRRDEDAAHTCDIKNCLRHLYPASRSRNMQDASDRGRLPRGEAHYKAKLTRRQVRRIRQQAAQGARLATLAGRLGVSPTTVSDAVRRRTWRHVEPS
jgi:hypothetical protein